ncbi:thiamine pyrophosphate-binding protein [Rhizohabitans arisaemae]|uniref:thiamine pyrophosphate-binding protein n=1 Tax=Rhizohabitans arisaemae TaxID=2720610 RepID=UPI0024B19351|nr:thiamine pyrophosphate-binding protein [Rhizohabitans arisaemae]
MSDKVRAAQITARLRAGGAEIAASLPDSWLSALIDAVTDTPEITHVRVTREDDGVAVCAGASLMGRRAVLVCQNAGLLLSANVLAGYAHHHRIPLVVIAADRGGPEDGFYYQAYKGRVTPGVLTALELPWHRVGDARDDWLFERAFEQAAMHRSPVVLLCSRAALTGESL